jgi:circadian clock protein KaiC
VEKGLLRFHASRPTFTTLEAHLAQMHRHIRDFAPALVIVDPISNFLTAGSAGQASQMVMRLIDFLKAEAITAVITDLTSSRGVVEATDVGISSLIDTWLLLRDVELNGERNRALYILKSRGMAHSNQVREFILTNTGIELRDVYVGAEGVLTGSSRLQQEAKERAAELTRAQEVGRRKRELERKRLTIEAEIVALRAAYEREAEELQLAIAQQEQREAQLDQDRGAMEHSRGVMRNEPARPRRRGEKDK